MVTVTSREEVDALVQSGLRLRATHETKMNAVSSRSHTVFTIHVFQQGECAIFLLLGGDGVIICCAQSTILAR